MSLRKWDEDLVRNHMAVPWHDYAGDPGEHVPIRQAPLAERASIVGRVGLMLLACGTGAWRVRKSMNEISSALGMSCTTNIGLVDLEYTCFDGEESFTRSLALTGTGINTAKLDRLERFVRSFGDLSENASGEELHTMLDDIEHMQGFYSPLILGLASALACAGFIFLLGGGIPEVLMVFCGAGVGNGVKALLGKRHYTLYLCVAVSVACACFTYALLFMAAHALWGLDASHQYGYIGAMLFIIPGFPFITSGIDMAKQDLHSGIERLVYAILIILVATLTGWVCALVLGIAPGDFAPLGLSPVALCLLRILASFCGVFGFSLMYNSPVKMAATAGCVGMLANTLRLELVDLAAMPAGIAAFIGALVAGLLASLLRRRVGYPRISITVPSIVIMVPGMYLYKAVYNLGVMNLDIAIAWLASAVLIIAALPLGLVFARILTDRSFRHAT